MFIHLQTLERHAANEPPRAGEEVIRIDLIQRLRPIVVSGIDGPCVEVVLDNEETILCRGPLEDLMRALTEEFFNETAV